MLNDLVAMIRELTTDSLPTFYSEDTPENRVAFLTGIRSTWFKAGILGVDHVMSLAAITQEIWYQRSLMTA